MALLKRLDSALALSTAAFTEKATLLNTSASQRALASDPSATPDQHSGRILVMFAQLDPGAIDLHVRSDVAGRFASMSDAQLAEALDFLESAPARIVFAGMAIAPARAAHLGWQMASVIVTRARTTACPTADTAADETPLTDDRPYLPPEYRDLDPEDPSIPSGLRELARQHAREKAAGMDIEALLAEAEAALQGANPQRIESVAASLRAARAGREDNVPLSLAIGRIELRRAMVDVPRGSRVPLVNTIQLAAASKALEHAAALQPRDPEVQLSLGYVRFVQQDFYAAEAIYRRVEKAGYRGALLQLRLGDLAHARGDLEQAMQHHSAALAAPGEALDAKVAFYALAMGDARPSNWRQIEPLLDHYLIENAHPALEVAWYADAAWRAGNDPISAQKRIAVVPEADRFGYHRRVMAEALVMRAWGEPLGADGALSASAAKLLGEAAGHYDLIEAAVSLADDAEGARALSTLYRHGVDVAEPRPQVGAVNVALASDHYEAVAALIALGIDIDSAPGMPLLHQAIIERQPALVDQLLKRGADPDARDGMGRNARDLIGNDTTPAAAEISMLLKGG